MGRIARSRTTISTSTLRCSIAAAASRIFSRRSSCDDQPSSRARVRNVAEQVCAASANVELLHVVINHLRLREPVPDATVEAARNGMQLVVDAGALAARVAKVDETHLILILEFSTAEDADRIAREVGGPWMRENIRPLLAGDTERSVAEVIASAGA
jgi:precorrin isomerase